jgi:uncharacterized protein RhaS with RHS repeats
LETGQFLSRDPAGLVDGPNLYTYVQQNPWTAFDPLGLAAVSINEIENRSGSKVPTDSPSVSDSEIRGKSRAVVGQAIYRLKTDQYGNAGVAIVAEDGRNPEEYYPTQSQKQAADDARELQDALELATLAVAMATPLPFDDAAVVSAVARRSAGSARIGATIGGRLPAAKTEGLAYRAINPQFAESTAQNGFFRSGAPGRLGNDGIYANTTPQGAIAEFQFHNPGVTPAVFEVNYPLSPALRIDPPSGYFSQPLPFTGGANILQAPSLRAPGTQNFLIREGATPGLRLQ